MLFVQPAAPTGWTKSTANDNKALRVVSGTASTGGSTSFTSAFGTPSVSGSVSLSGTVGAHTLTTSELAGHRHFVVADVGVPNPGGPSLTSGNQLVREANPSFSGQDPTPSQYAFSGTATDAGIGRSSSAGGGSSHTHSFSGSGSLSSATAAINVQYVDVIIATKN
jgi:hypothetical protein